MRIYIISKYKIQALTEQLPFVDFAMDDILECMRNSNTCIVDNEELAMEKLESSDELNYIYIIELNPFSQKVKINGSH